MRKLVPVLACLYLLSACDQTKAPAKEAAAVKKDSIPAITAPAGQKVIAASVEGVTIEKTNDSTFITWQGAKIALEGTELRPVFTESDKAKEIELVDLDHDGNKELVLLIDDPMVGGRSTLLVYKIVNNKPRVVQFKTADDFYEGLVVKARALLIAENGDVFAYCSDAMQNDIQYISIDKYSWSARDTAFSYVENKLLKDMPHRINEIKF